MEGIIGRKLGMTQLFGADGNLTPVTVIAAESPFCATRHLRIWKNGATRWSPSLI